MNNQNDDFQFTSYKKYPVNKYYDFKDISKDPSNRHCSLNYDTITTDGRKVKNQKNQSNNTTKSRSKSIVKQGDASKTASSSRITRSYKSKGKYQKKQIIQNLNDEIKNYKTLCLELRRENCTLKEDLKESKQSNKQALQVLQKKVERLNDQNNINLLNRKSNLSRQTEKQGSYKKFFTTIMDSFQRIEPKLKRKLKQQKTMSSKITLSRCFMNEVSSFLGQNNFKAKISLI